MNCVRTPSQHSLVAALALCALLFSGCAEKNSNAIIGKWHADKSPSITEFRPDGTMILNDNGKISAGRYKFTDASHLLASLKINMAADAQGKLPAGVPKSIIMNLDCIVKVSGDEMDMDVTVELANFIDKKKQTDHVHMKRVR